MASFGGMFKTVHNEVHNECEAASHFRIPTSPTSLQSNEAKALELMPALTPEDLPAHGTGSKQKASNLRLGELVGFLMGCCGSVAAAFRLLDTNHSKTLDMKEWENGVHKLGFADDVSYVFRLLGKNSDEVATLDEVQTLFVPFLKPAGGKRG